jgi:hypothetical protein
MRVGKAWISLDSLVRIETFQWVTLDFRGKKFRAPFCPAAAAPLKAASFFGKKKRMSQISQLSAFLQ